jgi:hypothetical protein
MSEGCKWLRDVYAEDGGRCNKEVAVGNFCTEHVPARKNELARDLENIAAQITYLKRQYSKKENELEALGDE